MKYLSIIKIFLLFFVLAYPLGQFGQIPLALKGREEIRLNLIDLLLFLNGIFWLLWHYKSGKKIILPVEFKYFFLFSGFLFLSWLINLKNFALEESLIGFLYLLRFLNYSFVYWEFYDLRKNSTFLSKGLINKILFFWIISLGVISISQYLFIPDTRFLISSGWDDHYYRVIGSFLDPNFTGIFLALALIWSVKYFSSQSLSKKKYWKMVLLFLILLPAFFLTYSRSSYLALIGGFTVYWLLRSKAKNLLALLFIFILVIFLLPRPGGEGVRLERTASIALRLENWRAILNLVKENPLFGVGFNNLRYALRKTDYLKIENWRENHSAAGAENSFLFILATGGFVSLMGFGLYFFKVIKDAFPEKEINIVLISSFAAVFIHCFFTNSFFYPWIYLWLMILISLKD